MASSSSYMIIRDESELPEVASVILNKFPDERVFGLYGDLGAGKTTFIKVFCKALEVTDDVASPSFSIVNEYLTKKGARVYHFDFFRIKKQVEVLDIGFEEYLYSGSFCFMEWPEKINELLPDNYVYIKIETAEDEGSRKISFSLMN